MCTTCSDCAADMYGDAHIMYTPACTGAQDTCLVHTTLTVKMHTMAYTRASTPVRQCSNLAMQPSLSATHLAI